MPDSNNTISFGGSEEDSRNGNYVVMLTRVRPKAKKETLIILLERQHHINQLQAEELLEALELYGRPIECRFTEITNARMFVLTCEMAGAICEFNE
jgi:hypothetical protein